MQMPKVRTLMATFGSRKAMWAIRSGAATHQLSWVAGTGFIVIGAYKLYQA